MSCTARRYAEENLVHRARLFGCSRDARANVLHATLVQRAARIERLGQPLEAGLEVRSRRLDAVLGDHCHGFEKTIEARRQPFWFLLDQAAQLLP